MRILIISDVSSWMPGGVPAETRELIGGLTGRGHVVALASDAPLKGAEGARHFPLTIPVSRLLVDEVERALRTFEPDFVHVVCMSSKGVITLSSVLRSHPWALTVHSVSPYERKLPRWHDHEGLHYAARYARFFPHTMAWHGVCRSGRVPRVIVHSDFMRRVLARYGCASDRVTLVPLAFHAGPPDRRTSSSREGNSPRLVTVGGIAHTKGQHDLIRALAGLRRRFPGIQCQLIGEVRDESYLRWIRSLVDELGLQDCVSITPSLGHEAKVEALARADVYVQPSHEEGFCLSYAEAAAVVPRLVGTDTGAIAAMSKDDPGAIVVAPRRPAEILDAVSRLLAIDLPRDHLKVRAERLSARFSAAAYLDAHERIYAARSR